jgi:hypothetical protein
VVVASGDELCLLSIGCADGSITCTARHQLPQQASALALLQVPAAAGAASCWLVAVGLWVDNAVVLLQLDTLAEVASVSLGQLQARSSALLEVPAISAQVLLVGTSTGSVLMWDLRPGAGSRWSLTAGRQLQISTTSVQLLPAPRPPGAPAAVYAHAGSDVLLSPLPWRPSSSSGCAATQLVCAARVVGADGLQAACALHAPDMPHSMAWVSAAGRLCFGSLDAAPKLRWASTLVADTPEALAMDPLTSTCAVLTRSLAGEQQLRVVEAATLRQLLAVR